MPQCHFCQSDNLTIFQASADPFKVLRCQNCGIVFVNPQPKIKSLSDHYDNIYYREWIDKQRPKRIRMWERRLNKISRIKPGGRLLDIGCGEGLFIKTAQEKGWEIEGTEISEYACRFAKKNVRKNIRHGEPWEAGYPSQSFDVVTIWHVLEHMIDPIKTLKEARRVIKNDGLCVVAVPNVNDLLMQLAYLIIRQKKQTLFTPDDKELHLYHFSARTLETCLKKAGFSSVEIGPDFGIIERGKKIINAVSTIPFYMIGAHTYNGLEAQAKP